MGGVGATNGAAHGARSPHPCARSTDALPAVAPLAYDVLTGLVSLEVFEGQVERALHRAWRSPSTVSVLLLRVGDLCLLADRFGAAVANEVLAAASVRLLTAVRGVDLVARVDAETLGVMLEADRRQANAEVMASEVANRLMLLFAEPLSTSVADLAVRATVGIAVADAATLTEGELIHRAGLALSEVGPGTSGGFRFYEAAQQDEAVQRLRLRGALGRAVDREAFSVRYQPIVSLHSGAIVAVEALLRWTDPEFGVVSPCAFIPLAEESDLIRPIGEWVLRTALAQQAQWTATIPRLPTTGLSVNVSARQLAHPGLVDLVRTALEDADVAPGALLLELTESAVMVDDDVVREQLAGLRDSGVRLALDDFGTGWSSLEYLSRVPVDVLKIAQPFVDQIGLSSRATSLVRSIVDLAHSLGLITVAEGVENEEQADRLRQMGCFLGQGWHFARDLSADETAGALRSLAADQAFETSP